MREATTIPYTCVYDAPTRREAMPRKEVGAQTVELGEQEIATHGLLDSNDVDVLISHVVHKLATMVEAADVPEEGSH